MATRKRKTEPAAEARAGDPDTMSGLFQEYSADELLDGKTLRTLLSRSNDSAMMIEEDCAALRGRLLVDKLSLDEEFVMQPQLFMEIGETLSAARYWVDGTAALVRELQGRVNTLAREEAVESGIKITEAHLASIVEADPTLNAVRRMQTEWRRIHSLADALREAAVQRASSLNSLARLWEREYFVADCIKESAKGGD